MWSWQLITPFPACFPALQILQGRSIQQLHHKFNRWLWQSLLKHIVRVKRITPASANFQEDLILSTGANILTRIKSKWTPLTCLVFVVGVRNIRSTQRWGSQSKKWCLIVPALIKTCGYDALFLSLLTFILSLIHRRVCLTLCQAAQTTWLWFRDVDGREQPNFPALTMLGSWGKKWELIYWGLLSL